MGPSNTCVLVLKYFKYTLDSYYLYCTYVSTSWFQLVYLCIYLSAKCEYFCILKYFKYAFDSTWQDSSTLLISASVLVFVLDKIPKYLYFT